jgi:hypothetical protein
MRIKLCLHLPARLWSRVGDLEGEQFVCEIKKTGKPKRLDLCVAIKFVAMICCFVLVALAVAPRVKANLRDDLTPSRHPLTISIHASSAETACVGGPSSDSL